METTVIKILTDLFTLLYGVPYLPEAIIVAFTLAVVQWAKSKGLKVTYAPALSIAVAVALSLVNAFVTGSQWVDVIAPGIVTGLAASGLYSNAKAPLKGEDSQVLLQNKILRK